ncbi:MAG TPA: MerR family transcriptional regulator [Candidatus Cloacimonadota bacterium]|nr:MerR family transcriptional regulator [Candidatus Cloacimonadota bacterium]
MNKELYPIGIVSKQLNLHEQTIREYENQNLIKPFRKNGRRYFSQEDLNRISLISTMTQEMGLNLAGVSVVFQLSAKMNMNEEDLLGFIIDHKERLLLANKG